MIKHRGERESRWGRGLVCRASWRWLFDLTSIVHDGEEGTKPNLGRSWTFFPCVLCINLAPLAVRFFNRKDAKERKVRKVQFRAVYRQHSNNSQKVLHTLETLFHFSSCSLNAFRNNTLSVLLGRKRTLPSPKTTWAPPLG